MPPFDKLIPLTAIVLGAGQSTRMGDTNKLLLTFRGKAIIKHVLDLVCAFPFHEVIVVTGHQQSQIVRVLSEFSIRCVYNEAYETGLASSIVKGISQSDPATGGYILFLGDMPFIQFQTVKSLIRMYLKASEPIIAVPVYGGKSGHPVLFPRPFKNELLELAGDRGARSILRDFPTYVKEAVVTDEGILRDLDTMEAFDKIES